MSFVEVVITFTRISISTKEATKHPHLRGLKVVQMKGYTLFSRAEKNTLTKYSSPEKLGYFLPNFAQYILWVKGGKIYTYAEPRTVCKEKYKTCVHSNIRNLLQNNLANFNQT